VRHKDRQQQQQQQWLEQQWLEQHLRAILRDLPTNQQQLLLQS
jgi:hypothetical protein